MRIKDKMKLIDAVKRELYQQFNSENIGTFLGEFNLPYSNKIPNIFDFGSYVDDRMEGISNDNLMKMIEELDMNADAILTAHRMIESSKSSGLATHPTSLLGVQGLSNAGLGMPRLSDAGLGAPRPSTIAEVLSGKSAQLPSTGLTTPPSAEETRLLYARLNPAKPKHDSSPAKAFISYETNDVNYANKISAFLKEFNIEAFVAYKDAREAEEFQEEILTALNKMDFFISIHTEQFSKSVWCQQEIGFAVAKGVKIIPIKLRTPPDGFIGKIHAIARDVDKIEAVVETILNILQKSPKTKDLYSAKIAPNITN